MRKLFWNDFRLYNTLSGKPVNLHYYPQGREYAVMLAQWATQRNMTVPLTVLQLLALRERMALISDQYYGFHRSDAIFEIQESATRCSRVPTDGSSDK